MTIGKIILSSPLTMTLLISAAFSQGTPSPTWQATVENSTAIQLTCQILDYSNAHLSEQLEPCVYTTATINPGTASVSLPAATCPTNNGQWALTPNYSTIGIDCFGPNNECYQIVNPVGSGLTVTMNCPSAAGLPTTPAAKSKRNQKDRG